MSELNIEHFAELENARVERIAALVPYIRLSLLKAIDQQNPSLLQPLYQMSAGKYYATNIKRTFLFDSFTLDLTRNNPSLPLAVEPFASVLEGNSGIIEINTGIPADEQAGIIELHISTDGSHNPNDSSSSLLLSTSVDGELHIGISEQWAGDDDDNDLDLDMPDANDLIETRRYPVEEAIQIGAIVTEAIVNSANWQVIPNLPQF
ncbi:MAG TPA: hypothetical protein VLG16_05790 [Candidatus Saccharimonadales bacterium]|nr:hypothetical protein [Candidatus Saccharimonadales bacterium]